MLKNFQNKNLCGVVHPKRHTPFHAPTLVTVTGYKKSSGPLGFTCCYTTDLYSYFDRKIASNFALFFQGKILSRKRISLTEYNIRDGSEITIQYYMLNGGFMPILQSFSATINKFYLFMLLLILSFGTMYVSYDMPVVENDFRPMSEKYNISIPREFLYKPMISQSLFVNYFNNDKDKEWIMDLMESLILLLQDLHVSFTSKNYKINVSMALARFMKSRTKSSLFLKLFSKETADLVAKMNFFEDQSFQDKLDDFKDILNRFEEIKESKLMTHLKQIMNYAIAFSFFEKLGVPLHYSGYSVFEKELLQKKQRKTSKVDFVHSVLTNLHYLTEKGYQYFVTGNKSAIFHSSKEYTILFDKIALLRMQAKLLTNPTVHGFTEAEYRANLDDTIDKLTSVIKYNDALSKFEKARMQENLNELKMLRFELTTLRASREHREAPFSILLYGDSGIGKSTLKDIFFYHYAKIFNLPDEKSYCYTRNAVAKFWDGFVSSCWCIILDDIAFRHPNLGEDSSCMEFLQINNYVPFVPDQASLDMKGRTPLRCKLVIATTNCKNLNSHFYFSCASAAQRRFPFIITPTVKKEFQDENKMLDSTKCEVVEGEYPNYWDFKVEKVKSLPAVASNLGRPADFELVGNFTDINDFLTWYSKAAVKHAENQTIIQKCIDSLSNITICKKCFKTTSVCTCLADQSFSMAYVGKYFLYQVCLAFWSFIFTHLIYYMGYLYCGGLQGMLARFIAINYPNLFSKSMRDIYIATGRRMQKKLGKYQELITYASLFAIVLASYKSTMWIWSSLFDNKHYNAPKQNEEETGRPPQPKEVERDNVWYNENTEISEFNLTPQITSSKSLSRETMVCKISKNCHVFIVQNARLHYRKTFRALNVVGNKFLINDHSHRVFVADDECFLISSKGYGISSNYKFTLSERCVKRDKDNDLCMLTIKQVNPGPDIVNLFPISHALARQNGFYIRRDEDGAICEQDVKNTECVRYQGDDFYCPGYRTYVETPTRAGDCGMPLIIDTPMGYAIGGIHVGGKDHDACATRITLAIINNLLNDGDVVFQEGNPSISAPSQNMILGELNPKSVFNYIDNGCAKIYGSFKGFRRQPKTMVEDTPLHDVFRGLGYKKKYTKPLMSGYVPFRTAALDMVNPVTNFNVDILDECTQSFLSDILKGLDIDEIKHTVHPYDLHTAINGHPGVAYVDRLKVKTSAGNPWKCKKSKFLQKIEGTEDYTLSEEMKERVDNIIKTYKSNTRWHPVFCAHLKDEPVTFAKAKIGKTRVFTGAPMDWSIVNRKFYLSLIRLIQNNKFAFETGVGTIAQSKEWSKVLQYMLREECKDLTKYEIHELIERFIAGDYKAFDKRMAALFILKAFWLLIEICKLSGNYTEEDIKVLWGIAYDTAFPTVDFNGDLAQFCGSNPSGHPLTVIINSLVNSLYIRYAYRILNPNKRVDTFQDDVRLFTYGDDNIMTSKQDWFNHTTISKALATFGVTYTMADKEAESKPFIHLSEVSFLKRRWFWNDELRCYLAPLEHESIEKMLMTWTRSKISEENQMMDIIKSACSEYFFYGKTTYNSRVKLFRKVIEDKGWGYMITPSTFPTWQQMKERFRKSSNSIGLYVDDRLDDLDYLSDSEDSVYSNDEDYLSESYESVCSDDKNGGLWIECSTNLLYALGQLINKIPEVRLEPKCTSNCCVIDVTQDSIEEEVVKYPSQSSIQQSHQEDGTTQATTVKFNDETSGEATKIPLDFSSEEVTYPASVAIEKFLNRPVLIQTYTWTLGGTTNSSFFPWNEYFSHSSIKKKLDNYYLIRCKLKLKFVINASPFHYGTLLAAYKPLQSFLTPAPIDTISTGITSDLTNVPLSQLPRVYIYPQTSQGGEITLPFLYPKEWLDITGSVNTSEMGQVILRPMTPLQFANTGVGVNCTVQVFAWAEDVELSGPTVALAMQSRVDEYGVISGPASALAEAAGMLEDAPIIGKYATATRMLSSTYSDVSKMFGYTNVPVIEDVHSFTPSPFPQFASPEIGTQLEKLTMDPKNELTIDPRSVGLDTGDELLIDNIVRRESYLTQFPWTMAGAADDILFSLAVSPYLQRIASGTNQTIVQMTPMSLVGRMFAYWRGDIKIRLKFNCSQYHKGRLRLSFDPVGAIGSTADSTTEVFTQIIDISDCTDVTINIPYMQNTAFLNRWWTYTQSFSNNGATTNTAGFSNGVFTARILTELSAPLNTSDIQVLVFVSGGDNLEFACPTDIEVPGVAGVTPICAYPAQSKFEHYDINCSQIEMGDDPSSRSPATYLKYHGEVIKSLRTLIRRTSLMTDLPFKSDLLASTADNLIAFNRLSRYPYYPGYATSNVGLYPAVGQVSGNYRYNFVKWHPMTWISQCYLGCRGSINYRFNLNTKLDVSSFTVARPALSGTSVLSTADYFNSLPTLSTANLARQNAIFHDYSGISLTNTKTNTGLNVSIPYYSKYKFRTTSPIYPVGSSTDDTNKDWYQIKTIFNPKADSNATSTYSGMNIGVFVGAGTDYSPIFFCNVPTLYIYSNYPNSA